MTGAWRAACAAAGSLAVAACQPLPHPFADDGAPASLLGVRDSRGVSIAPIAGEPRAIAVMLRSAVVKALLKQDIPASEKTASVTSYQLGGRIDERVSNTGGTVLTVHWRLTDSAGRVVGEPAQRIEEPRAAAPQESGEPVERLAAAAANSLVPLITDAPPRTAPATAASGGPAVAAGAGPAGAGPASAAGQSPAAPARKRPVVLVAQVGGAPGDGDAALTNAMATVLRSEPLDVVTGAQEQKPDLTVAGTVAVSAIGRDKQHVTIVWALRRVDGSQIGTVDQQNDVPKGSLDHSWGEVAYNIAVAARSGILELVSHAKAGGTGKKS